MARLILSRYTTLLIITSMIWSILLKQLLKNAAFH